MSTTTENVPHDCPGTESERAGKESACAGCPNQQVCATGPKGPDPSIELIREQMVDVKHKIVVLSGKGGVGKSTIAANLCYSLARDENLQICLLDVDICGPSQPTIMGVESGQVFQSASGWSPVYVTENLGVLSTGFLLSRSDQAVIWRGPKKNGLIKQFLRDVDWGEQDYLIIDTPPGTSDEHLSIVQYLSGAKLDGAIIVTTPQEISLLDVRKEISFCRKVKVPILGVVENMSAFVCPSCSHTSTIFPKTTGGAEQMCREMNVPYLGSVPLDPLIGQCGDTGRSLFAQCDPEMNNSSSGDATAISPTIDAFNCISKAVQKSCGGEEVNGT